MSDKFSDPRRVLAPGLFDGTTALVSGAGRGIGQSIAMGFAELGASVVLASNEPDELDGVAADVRSLGRDALVVDVNIRDIDSVEAMTNAALERFGAIDFLINNAGGQFRANPFAISDNGWRAVVDLNLNGTWNMCSRVVPHMMRRGRGSVVNVVHNFCSERGAPLFAHSGAARAGVINLTRSLAPYLEGRNVTINALAPGVTISAAAAANYGWTEEEWRAQPSRSRYADPEDMAAITLFMCSPAARMLNGSLIVADAAMTQTNWPLIDEMFAEVDGMFGGGTS